MPSIVSKYILYMQFLLSLGKQDIIYNAFVTRRSALMEQELLNHCCKCICNRTGA